VAPSTVLGQEPAPAAKPAGPGPTPPPTAAEPVPVIPEAQPFPPSTVPSAPQRRLPAADAGLPPTATFKLEPTITLSEEYTDNFNLTERDKLSNFRSTVSPGLRVLINSAFTKGTIAYTFSPAHDSATDDLQLFHSLLGQVTWEANPLWKITLADTFTRGDQPLEADRLGLRQERQTFTTNTFSLSSDYLIAGIATRQSYQWSTFSDDDGGKTTSHTLAAAATVPLYETNSLTLGYDYLTSTTSGDSDSLGGGTGGTFAGVTGGDVSGHQFTAAASRQLNRLRSAGVKGSYAFRTLTDDLGDTDYRLWNVSVFTNYVLQDRLTISGSLGVSGLIIDSGDGAGPNLFSTTNISYLFGRAVASLTVDQGFSETFAGGQDFGVVETRGVTGSLTYPFTPLLAGTVTGSYRQNKTTGVGNVGTGAGGEQESESWGGTATLTFKLLRNVLLDVTYSYLNQGATEGGGSSGTTFQSSGQGGYVENRVKASLNVSF
jgi:hypothetical protein